MKIAFDAAKHRRNVEERGLGFDYAALIFEGETVEWQDTRRDYGEERFIAIGEVEGNALVIVYTDRTEARRIISARFTNSKERLLWQSRYEKR